MRQKAYLVETNANLYNAKAKKIRCKNLTKIGVKLLR